MCCRHAYSTGGGWVAGKQVYNCWGQEPMPDSSLLTCTLLQALIGTAEQGVHTDFPLGIREG